MFKVFRMGHRHPNKGVITIASHIQDNKIFYGVSYYSPHELTVAVYDAEGKRLPKVPYSKQYGIQLASERLQNNIDSDIHLPLIMMQHSVVLLDIIGDILDNGSYPQWAEDLLVENVMYPVGLQRYSKTKNNEIGLKEIVVSSEEDKEQLLIASGYLHNLLTVDKSFNAINLLSHLYLSPDSIRVEP